MQQVGNIFWTDQSILAVPHILKVNLYEKKKIIFLGRLLTTVMDKAIDGFQLDNANVYF